MLTTHDMDEADRLCDRLAILNDGRVVVEGTPAELRASLSGDGHNATLHDVFMQHTGRSLDDDVDGDDKEDE